MSRLFLKHGKFAIVSVLFPQKIASFHSHSRHERVKGYRLRKPRSSSWLMTHKSVRESHGPSVHWSHCFFHCLAISFFFCCMSFSHTHHITCIGLPPLIQAWKAVENTRRAQRHLLLLQGNSYKTFQSKHRRKWFPKSHNSVDIPHCSMLIVRYANLIMSNGSKSRKSSFAKTGNGNGFFFLIRHLFFVFYYFIADTSTPLSLHQQ